MNHNELPHHPAFLRLGGSLRTVLGGAAEIWEAPAGAVLYHPGDSGEDLLFLLEGRLESSGEGGKGTVVLPGDLWGEDRLAEPRPVVFPLAAVDNSRWLRWSRETLLSLLSSSNGLRKSLSPVRDGDGRLISGLASQLPSLAAPGGHHRRFRPSARPLIPALVLSAAGAAALYALQIRVDTLPALMPLAAPAVYAGWLIVFLVRRLLTEYGIDADSITARSIDWRRFTVESRHVPMDRVQGVETDQSGLLKRMMGTGTVIVKTSAVDGVLVLRDICSPRNIAQDIQSLRENVIKRSRGRDREAMRRTLERSGLGGAVPVLLRESARGIRTKDVYSVGFGEIRFRKSLFVLAGRLFLPVLLTALVLLGIPVITGLLPLRPGIVAAASLFPLLWGLYRFEDWRNDLFLISGGYVVDLYRRPLGLKETRRQVELSSVQNIRTEQKGVAAFLFRYGNVILVTSGGAADTVFTNVSRPWRVQANLFRRREEYLRSLEASRREQNKDDLTGLAEAMNQIRIAAEGRD